MRKITSERMEKILGHALDWFSEHFKAKEMLDILHDHLDMTDEEIEFFGFDFSDLEQDDDGKFSIVHLHDFEDDCCVITSSHYDLYEIAKIYCTFTKEAIGDVTLDSFAYRFADPNWIDERLYPILCQSMNNNEKIAIIIDFNFEDDELIYSMNSEKEKIYDLVDLSKAFEKSNRDDGLNPASRKSIFYANILGKELNSITESESESPSMSM